MLEPLHRLVGRADRRLRTSRVLRDTGVTATWVFVGMAIACLVIEVGWGLTLAALPVLAIALLIPIGAAIRALVLPPGTTRAAKAVDVGAGLHDRVGTAIALEGAPGPMVARQREDALAAAAGVAVGRAVPLYAVRSVRGSIAALIAFTFVATLCLALDLRPAGPATEVGGLERSGEDLLSMLGEIEADAVARGNKPLARAVTDLHDRVQQIVDEEKERRNEQPPDEPPPPQDAPPPDTPAEMEVPEGLYSVSELEAMHAQLQVELGAAVNFNLEEVRIAARDVVRKSRELRQFQHEIDNQLMRPEWDVFDASSNDRMSATDQMARLGKNPMNFDDGNDMTGNSSLQDAVNEMNVQEISTESLAADDRKHAMQQLFSQFLEEYTAERGEQLADWLAGKGEGTPRVKVEPDEQLQDKSDAMAEAGFEDVTDTPGDENSDSGTAGLQAQPTDHVPEGAELKTLAEAGLQPEGMALGEGMAETTEGAQGAGKGDGSSPIDGDSREIRTQPGERLEQILGQINDDSLPEKKRREVLEEVAQHKIQGGLANDFGDDRGNYFEEAGRLLLEESDELPPLFRDYAHEYFQALLDL